MQDLCCSTTQIYVIGLVLFLALFKNFYYNISLQSFFSAAGISNNSMVAQFSGRKRNLQIPSIVQCGARSAAIGTAQSVLMENTAARFKHN